MFLENSKYKIWILHKKLVKDEIVSVFHISIHISLNIGPRILNPYTPEYPFPSAVHLYSRTQNHSRWVLLRHLTQKIVLVRYLMQEIPTCWYLLC